MQGVKAQRVSGAGSLDKPPPPPPSSYSLNTRRLPPPPSSLILIHTHPIPPSRQTYTSIAAREGREDARARGKGRGVQEEGGRERASECICGTCAACHNFDLRCRSSEAGESDGQRGDLDARHTAGG